MMMVEGAKLPSRRRGVSLEDVKNAVATLRREGLPVTLRSIRAELGLTGSLATISKHLTALEGADSGKNEVPSQVLPTPVLESLAAEVAKLVAERTTRIEAELHDARSAVRLLTDENARVESMLEEAQGIVQSMQASEAEHAGMEAGIRAQLLDAGDQLTWARREAEEARQRAALLELQLEMSAKRENQLESQLTEVGQELRDLSKRLSDATREAEAARLSAASLEAQVTASKGLEGRIKDLGSKLSEQEAELGVMHQRLPALEVERRNLSERLAEASKLLERAQANEQRLLEKVLAATGGTAVASPS